jgi:hypothetical protein
VQQLLLLPLVVRELRLQLPAPQVFRRTQMLLLLLAGQQAQVAQELLVLQRPAAAAAEAVTEQVPEVLHQVLQAERELVLQETVVPAAQLVLSAMQAVHVPVVAVVDQEQRQEVWVVQDVFVFHIQTQQHLRSVVAQLGTLRQLLNHHS